MTRIWITFNYFSHWLSLLTNNDNSTFKYVSAGSNSAKDLNQTPGPSKNEEHLQKISVRAEFHKMQQ